MAGQVIATAAMSLDGFIADTSDAVGPLFDLTDGWGGRPAVGDAVFVVTHETPARWAKAHPDAPFTFVTDGLARPITQARRYAGDRVTHLRYRVRNG